MTTTTHPVAPEEIMAWLDGELPAAEARTVLAHISDCSECAAVRDEFMSTSHILAEWKIPDAPRSIENTVNEALFHREANRSSTKSFRPTRSGFRNWKVWTIAGAGFTVAVALLIRGSEHSPFAAKPMMAPMVAERQESVLQESMTRQPSEPFAQTGGAVNSLAMVPPPKSKSEMQNGPLAPFGNAQTSTPHGPMIARTASLTIQVKDFAAARSALDAIVSRHGGYSANLTVDTPENGQRHFQASLRIPATELTPALGDLKALGRALTESQSGEEVTQQHADLVARLQNSRETEARLRAILQQRTGKIEDVLQVEEEIARVRGEIESMEAEQQVLEHRVAFATVDLQLVEEYKEQFNPSPMSASGRLHNAFIEGMRNASGTILGLILFLEEFGPAILIWGAIIGVPIYIAWRRHKKFMAPL